MPNLSKAETAVAEAFREQSQKRFSPEQVEKLIEKRMRKVATGYEDGGWSGIRSALFGLDKEGSMGTNGIFYLRDSASSKALQLRIEIPQSPGRHARHLSITVRNRAGREESETIVLRSGTNDVALPLPNVREAKGRGERVFEIEWLFDYSNCDGPSSCTSGVLRSASFTS